MTEQTKHEQAPEVEAHGLPEAGGVAWVNLYSQKTGAKVNLTARADNPKTALDLIMDAIRYAHDEYHLAGTPPEGWAGSNGSQPKQAPTNAPQQAQAQTAETRTIKVERVRLGTTENNAPYLKVFGHPYNKWGVKCWPEVAEAQYDLGKFEAGQEYPENRNLTAVIEMTDGGNPRKVIKFE